MALVKDYLQQTQNLKTKYGDRTLVLMQVGSFYEVYGLKNLSTGEITGSLIEEVAKILGFNIANKTTTIGESQVVMTGFKDYYLDKYVHKIQQYTNLTIVVFTQYPSGKSVNGKPEFTRTISKVCSPGTNFDEDDKIINNNIMCIWLQKLGSKLIVGVSVLDNFTGKSNMYEYIDMYSEQYTSYDELERVISIYNPSETIIIHNLDNRIVTKIISYVSLTSSSIHRIKLSDETDNSKNATRCEKQTYQALILQKTYGDTILDTCQDFANYVTATQSFCYLLEFIYDHNPNLVNKINLPTFENSGDRLILGNHSLKQLNIIPNGISSGKNSSIESFLSMCNTNMGKRNLKHQLVSPTYNSSKLIKEYDIVEYLNNIDILNIRPTLKSVQDLEKYNRKIMLQTITPRDVNTIYESISIIKSVYTSYIDGDDTIKMYMEHPDIMLECNEVSSLITKYIDLDKCLTPNENINYMNSGICPLYDKAESDWINAKNILSAVHTTLNNIIDPYDNTNTSEYIKIHQPDKLSPFLVSTNKRFNILKEQLNGSCYSNTLDKKDHTKNELVVKYINSEGMVKQIILIVSELIYTKQTSNYSLGGSQLNVIYSNITSTQKKLVSEMDKLYKQFISLMTSHISTIDNISHYIALFDTITTKRYISTKYNLVRPIIDDSKDNSFIDIKGLRHLLIESLLDKELYVTNDINLGDTHSGMLLYGTNAVGKSSLIKAIGICVIMAQAGIYVPCSNMIYKPYKKMYTRIIGNDNIFKGLSTFVVEMLELKNILEKTNNYSLVLGDELCSGTETDSAISIIIAGIDILYKKDSTFMFATHFHELVKYEEIKIKDKLYIKHMSVMYNQELDMLIYNRLLQDGPGESMYGLEVCKSLHLPTIFLDTAHAIRNKYSTISPIFKYKSSRYNANKLMSKCEICKQQMGTEIHHLQHQHSAKDNGYIGSFHKNHVANLVSVCNECHDKMHLLKGHMWNKTTTGYKLISME
jgi:DNA mismatch repair protein MutS